MKLIDTLAKKFVKSATNEVVTELEEVKKVVVDGLPIVMAIGFLIYSLVTINSSSKSKTKSASTMVQHIYLGTSIDVHH